MCNAQREITQNKIDQAFCYLIYKYEIKCFCRFNNNRIIWCFFLLPVVEAPGAYPIGKKRGTSEYKLLTHWLKSTCTSPFHFFHLTLVGNEAALIIGRKERFIYNIMEF
jgi:hypothetical protein